MRNSIAPVIVATVLLQIIVFWLTVNHIDKKLDEVCEDLVDEVESWELYYSHDYKGREMN